MFTGSVVALTFTSLPSEAEKNLRKVRSNKLRRKNTSLHSFHYQLGHKRLGYRQFATVVANLAHHTPTPINRAAVPPRMSARCSSVRKSQCFLNWSRHWV